MNITTLVVGGLAVWRLSHALVKEDGPLMILARFRAFLARTQKRSGGFFDMISCTMCVSFWTGLIASLWVSHDVFHWVGYGFAFSGVSLLLESIFVKKPDSLTVVTNPAANNKVPISVRSTPEQRNNVVGHPNAPDGFMTVET